MLKKSTISAAFLILMALLLAFSAAAATYAKIGKIVESSSEREAARPNAHMIDGDESTRWGSMNGTDWIVLELEKAENIASVDFMFFRATERLYVINLEYSADGKDWKDAGLTKTKGVMDRALQPAGKDPANDTGYWDNFPLKAPVSAKYWKITFEGREETGTLNKTDAMSVWEVRFVVAEGAAATNAPTAATQATTKAGATGGDKAPDTGSMGFILLGVALFGSALVVYRLRKA